jgi:hypothetical protein
VLTKQAHLRGCWLLTCVSPTLLFHRIICFSCAFPHFFPSCMIILGRLHWCHTVVTLYTLYRFATLFLHCFYTVVKLLLHCCYTVVTLLLHCCYTADQVVKRRDDSHCSIAAQALPDDCSHLGHWISETKIRENEF